MRKTLVRVLWGGFLLVLATIGVFFLPPIHDRLGWRADDLISKIQYMISPPEKAVFVPQQSVDQIVRATLQAHNTTAIKPSATPTVGSTQSEGVAPGSTAPAPATTPTSTLAPTPLPSSVLLKGIVHEFQGWNNCGPATLAMALTYWGWKGDQRMTAPFLKPNPRDKNVMPYEMLDYVTQKTSFKGLLRSAGDIDLLKRLLAAGFPVVVEKGFEVSGEGWMGHYEVLQGYDDAKAVFSAEDSYAQKDDKTPLLVSYTDLVSNWRAFNDIYLIIYPPEQESDVTAILGPQADVTANMQYAAQKASDEIGQLTGRDQFFAWYDRGTSLVALSDYAGAGQAYDEAFKIYPDIPEKKRPWRMLWYQTGPYFAYFYSGRYQDVINLATTTLNALSEKAIEESFVWRARARAAAGDTPGAIDDLHAALQYHPGFTPAADELTSLGVAQ